MRGKRRLVSLLLTLILALACVTAWAEEAGGLPPIPLDDNGLIDLNMLEVLIGTTNADGVGVYFEPGGEELAVIPNTGTLVCVYAADDPLSPGWYQAAFESGDYVYSGYIESGTLAVAPVTDAENLLGSGAYALALNKMYDMSQPLPEQFPEGLYEAILAARPVYLSRTGSKYHYNPTCSNMRSPRETTLSSAVAAEKEPCSRCVKDNGSV